MTQSNTFAFGDSKGGLSDLCEIIYTMFGRGAVINFINDRQLAGEISHVITAECESCENWSPMDFGFQGYFCLICGYRPSISPLTGEKQ
jgi:hypothetical protein